VVTNSYYQGKPSDNYYFIAEIHNYPIWMCSLENKAYLKKLFWHAKKRAC
jgi:hypothetical protein